MNRRITFYLFIFATLIFAPTGDANEDNDTNTVAPSEEEERFQATPFLSSLAKIIPDLLPRIHYSHKEINDQVSRELFNEYFTALDPDRKFFLASDIEKFSSYKTRLDDLLQKGEIDFIFKVYRQLLQRVEERVEFARERLEDDFDFSRESYVALDRSDASWEASRKALDNIWTKRIKNRLLLNQLLNEASEKEEAEQGAQTKIDSEESGDSKKKDNGQEATGDQTPFFPDRTPKERTQEYYERYLTYLQKNQPIDVMEIFLGALGNIYDPHTTYMAPSTEEDFEIEMQLSLQGIGAKLTIDQGVVKVVKVIPGGPAAADGRLQKNDRIIAVAQEGEEPVNVMNMPLRKVVDKIRGKKGTKVYLKVIEAGQSYGTKPKIIDLVRDEVELDKQAAQSQFMQLPVPSNRALRNHVSEEDNSSQNDRGILTVRLPSFYSEFSGKDSSGNDKNEVSASKDVRQLIKQAKEQHEINGLLLDLRSNGGGSLKEAVKVAGLFLPEGPVVQVRDSKGRVRVKRNKTAQPAYEGPLVVLVNRLSASAAEIVAAALQDYGRAVLVGAEHTHGKGTVQSIQDLKRFFKYHPFFNKKQAGSIKFTMAKFYRVTGGSTQKRGVTPDIVLPSFREHMELGEKTLDHVLEWDQLDDVDFSVSKEIFFAEPFIPLVKSSSKARLKENKAFEKRRNLIQEFEAMRREEKVPLKMSERKKMQQREERLMERLRAQSVGTPSTRSPRSPEEERLIREQDLILQEGLDILADLLWLETHVNSPEKLEDPEVAHMKYNPEAETTLTPQESE